MGRMHRLLAGLKGWIWTRPPLAIAEVVVPVIAFACLLLAHRGFWYTREIREWAKVPPFHATSVRQVTEFEKHRFFSLEGLFVAISLGWILLLPALRPLSSAGLRPQQRWAICGLALLSGIFSSSLEGRYYYKIEPFDLNGVNRFLDGGHLDSRLEMTNHGTISAAPGGATWQLFAATRPNS
jgi:hypothetical protein